MVCGNLTHALMRTLYEETIHRYKYFAFFMSPSQRPGRTRNRERVAGHRSKKDYPDIATDGCVEA
jgi:hypothetical protein